MTAILHCTCDSEIIAIFNMRKFPKSFWFSNCCMSQNKCGMCIALSSIHWTKELYITIFDILVKEYNELSVIVMCLVIVDLSSCVCFKSSVNDDRDVPKMCTFYFSVHT